MFHGDDERGGRRVPAPVDRAVGGRWPATCSSVPERMAITRSPCSTSAGSSRPARSTPSPTTSVRPGLPEGLIRRINATNPDTNAWAALERSESRVGGVRAAVHGGGPRPRVRGRRIGGARSTPRPSPSRDGRGRPAMPHPPEDGHAHQQLRRHAGERRRFERGPGRRGWAWGRARTSTRWPRSSSCSTSSSSREPRACASPTRASTSWRARRWPSSRPRRCSSTTSASTSSPPAPWA